MSVSVSVRLKPTENRILVLVDVPADKSGGGVILPESAREEKKNTGVVIATGDGRLREDGTRLPLLVSVGDKVYFSRYSAGEPYEEGGATYSLMRDTDILGTYGG